MTEAAERRTIKAAHPQLCTLCCALWASESTVTLPGCPRYHRFCNLCMVGGISSSLMTYRMLHWWGVCLSCDSRSLLVSPTDRQRGDGGRGRLLLLPPLLLLLVKVVWVLTLICVTSLSLSPSRHATSFPLSLLTSLHITHTCMHTCKTRFGQITQRWGTKCRRDLFVSSPQQLLLKWKHFSYQEQSIKSPSPESKIFFLTFINCVKCLWTSSHLQAVDCQEE